MNTKEALSVAIDTLDAAIENDIDSIMSTSGRYVVQRPKQWLRDVAKDPSVQDWERDEVIAYAERLEAFIMLKIQHSVPDHERDLALAAFLEYADEDALNPYVFDEWFRTSAP